MENLIVYKFNNKKRIGKNNDGGYIVCDLSDSYDLFISCGINNDIIFEKDLLNRYPNLKCIAFDGTIQSLPENDNRIQFIKKNLGNNNSDTMTNLHEYMKDYNNIFMKMDIEGHEFRILPTIIENNYINKIKQLIIQIHSPADIQLYPNYFNGLSDITNINMFNLLSSINNTHTLVHFHANNGCKMTQIDGIDIPHVFELTYVRNDMIQERIKNTIPLPTNLDMKNIPHLPDYYFNCYPYVNKIEVNKYLTVNIFAGLGNRLFQVASSYGIAKKQGKIFNISVNHTYNNKHSNIDYNNTIFKDISKNSISENEKYTTLYEPHDMAIKFYNVPNINENILLNGYFQSEKYFSKYKTDIYNMFRMDNETYVYLTTKYNNLENKYFIHIRRGDYLEITLHYVNLDNYYKNCLNMLPNDSKFLIISDDVDYCKKLEIFNGNNFEFVENENELNSLYLMSLCKLGGIAANSSFSWWGGYLNENINKTVFFPNKWINADWDVEIGFTGCKIVSI
jgi:hypothetical protein